MNDQITSGRPTRVAPPPSETPTEAFAQPAPSHQPPAVRAPDAEPTVTPEPSRRVPFATGSFGKVVEAIAGVMAEIKPVEKLGWNKFHQYAHARIGDLNAELTPLMGKHGIVVFQNEVRRDMFDNGSVVSIQYEFTVVHKSGEVWPERPVISGMARCRTTKESFDDKTFNKCHTAARKYFLIGLFQIPVSDEDDANADHGSDGPPQQRPRSTRRPPSPDGKPTPTLIPVEDGELPTAWAKRFKEACGKADTPAAVQKWYEANVAIFEKIKRFRDDAINGFDVFNDLIDFMDELEVKMISGSATEEPPKDAAPRPSSSSPTGGSASSGTKRAPRQRRQAPPPPAAEEGAQPDDDTRLWLQSLENAFSSCEDAEALGEAQIKYMTPKKDEVSKEAWSEAVKLVRSHLERVMKA